jgi:hypothetical protein
MNLTTTTCALAGFLATSHLILRKTGLLSDVTRCTVPTSVGPCGRRTTGGNVCRACQREGRD